jgi:hypothetical protein
MEKQGTFEYVHHDLYGVALEVAKKFVSKSDERPILKYTFHAANGDLIATDTHRLIHIKGIHGFKEDFLVNPKNYMFAKGNYFDTEKVSSADGYEKSIVLKKYHIKLWLHVFKSIEKIKKEIKDGSKTVKMELKENEIFISSDAFNDVLKMQVPFDEYEKPNFDSILFNPEYMKDALEAHFKLNSNELTIYFKGQFVPIILDDGVMVKTLVLPHRAY